MTKEDEKAARGAADRLALALEDAGFDVGHEFPALHDAIGRQGKAVVRIGDVSPSIADRLAAALITSTSRDNQAKEDDSR